ncbi:MAG: glycoside hydrolase family 127 protein, partial [Verrucomicrobiae bacterium]|nr:glycoside hydrolase family 127 protein [Verrucomicrobiae bacterium]
MLFPALVRTMRHQPIAPAGSERSAFSNIMQNIKKAGGHVLVRGFGLYALVGLAAAAYADEPGRFLKAGEVMPQGWMKEQIRLDLEQGYLPKYGEVNHTVTHDVFVKKDRISQTNYNGLRCWWSGEHEGYWKDAILRMAFLAGDEKRKAEATRWLDEIVSAQDPDGYIGIYKAGGEPNHRFSHHGENGELWVQSRIFQALIAGCEFTGNERWFEALEKAVDCTIRNDPGNYFDPVDKATGGVSHAVGFFDALWYLHARTGRRKYADYAVKLYGDFNTAPVRDDDLQRSRLL